MPKAYRSKPACQTKETTKLSRLAVTVALTFTLEGCLGRVIGWFLFSAASLHNTSYAASA